VGRHELPRRRRLSQADHRRASGDAAAGSRSCHDARVACACGARRTLLAFAASDPTQLDVYAVADALWREGWYVDRQGPPASLHCTVNAVHEGKIDTFAAALRAAVAEVTAAKSSGDLGAYGTVE